MFKLGNLEGKMDDVIRRLDNMNGTLARHDKEIGMIKVKATILWGGATLAGLAIWEFVRKKLFNL